MLQTHEKAKIPHPDCSSQNLALLLFYVWQKVFSTDQFEVSFTAHPQDESRRDREIYSGKETMRNICPYDRIELYIRIFFIRNLEPNYLDIDIRLSVVFSEN